MPPTEALRHRGVSTDEIARRQGQSRRDLAMDERDILFTRREAATYLRRSVRTLELWAQNGSGPQFFMVNGRALYRLSDLRAAVGGSAA